LRYGLTVHRQPQSGSRRADEDQDEDEGKEGPCRAGGRYPAIGRDNDGELRELGDAPEDEDRFSDSDPASGPLRNQHGGLSFAPLLPGR